MIKFNQLSFWEKETFLYHIDFLIIGSGIVGLSTAIHLKKALPNKKVLVLERGYLPTGASTKNAGFACIGSASEILDDLKTDSASNIFSTLEKRWKGLQYLRQLLGDKSIDYQAIGSHELFYPREKNEIEACKNHLPYLNSELRKITGISENFLVANNICTHSGFNGFSLGISNAAEGQIDTGKMMSQLLKLAKDLGINIINGIQVNLVENNSVQTNYGNIAFKQLAICTNGLAKQFLPNEDIAPARAQVVVTSPIDNLKLKGIFHFDKGYYYFRNIENRVLFGGGRNLDFEAEETDELNTSDHIINHLSQLLETDILPNNSFSIEHHWAGTMGVGKAKHPIIQKVDKDIFCGVRLGGMGVAIGTLVGQELTQLILES